MEHGFPQYAGRFWLCDAGFALSLGFLVPYRGVRYHLKEWERIGLRPMNREELFNLRHASLRNCIERIFGVIKKRFPLLSTFQQHGYDFSFQVKLVRCAIVLHNVIRTHSLDNPEIPEDEFDAWNWRDQVFNAEAAEDALLASQAANLLEQQSDRVQYNAACQWRDTIAQHMWEAYQIELQQRGLNGDEPIGANVEGI